ncbi:hypothetical protein [Microbispora sp. H13382]|uniref:hypothetical protein n=1 Tax=Microbispora sp. H13382 TaxID=2729112 RepID=UPI00160024F2|nr:hypothetical protein [Microbispora sp. H13382]
MTGAAAWAVASLVLCFGGQSAWPIYAGRLITGFAVGIAMAVGSSWVKELSAGADGGLAARRAALCQTAGFGLGAGVAGVLAQWGPWPMVAPYVVHLLLPRPRHDRRAGHGSGRPGTLTPPGACVL